MRTTKIERHKIAGREIAGQGPVSTSKGTMLPWVSEIRYLGIYIKQSSKFKCSINNAKRSVDQLTL